MGLANDGLSLEIVGGGDDRVLRVSAVTSAELRDFEGVAGESSVGATLDGPLTAKNAAAVRTHLPWLRPRPVGLATSAGVGDRLGLATPGHVAAFRVHGRGVFPVFAQQSIREMERLDRTPQQVMDAATFGCVEAGWDSVVGADADHITVTEDIDRCVDAGYPSFTLDPGTHVRKVADSVSEDALDDLPWGELEDDKASLLRRYSELVVDLGEKSLRVEPAEVVRAAARYGAAVAYVLEMYRHVHARADRPIEIEIAVDETDEVTTYAEHVYWATEMRRLGMTWNGFAPRYIGDFEKGVEYIGDTKVLHDSLVTHSRIARALGPYKLSLHSGSDKFSIYGLVADATDRMVHLKTSGTSYMCALGVAADRAPELFREIYAVSREAYCGTRASYQVSARIDETPDAAQLPVEALGELLSRTDTRQLLHVGYGAVLTRSGHGTSSLADSLRSLLSAEAPAYALALEDHLGRHLQPFSEDAK
jgi:hypothetical protein